MLLVCPDFMTNTVTPLGYDAVTGVIGASLCFIFYFTGAEVALRWDRVSSPSLREGKRISPLS